MWCVQEASGEYVDSLLSLKPDELSKVAADPSGSRVLEAFLASNVARKVKAKLLKKLASHWATIAVTPAGNFFTEKSYAFGVSGSLYSQFVIGYRNAVQSLGKGAMVDSQHLKEGCKWHHS